MKRKKEKTKKHKSTKKKQVGEPREEPRARSRPLLTVVGTR